MTTWLSHVHFPPLLLLVWESAYAIVLEPVISVLMMVVIRQRDVSLLGVVDELRHIVFFWLKNVSWEYILWKKYFYKNVLFILYYFTPLNTHCAKYSSSFTVQMKIRVILNAGVDKRTSAGSKERFVVFCLFCFIKLAILCHLSHYVEIRKNKLTKKTKILGFPPSDINTNTTLLPCNSMTSNLHGVAPNLSPQLMHC